MFIIPTVILVRDYLRKSGNPHAHGSNLGSWQGIKIICIGPKGGRIVGYGAGHKPIYAGSATAVKLAFRLKQKANKPKEQSHTSDEIVGWLTDLGFSGSTDGDLVVVDEAQGQFLAGQFGIKPTHTAPGVWKFSYSSLQTPYGHPFVPEKAEAIALLAKMSAPDVFPDDLNTLKEIPAGAAAGSHGNRLFVSQDGRKWLFKPAKADVFIARAEEAASRVGQLILGTEKISPAKYVKFKNEDGVLIGFLPGQEFKDLGAAEQKKAISSHFEQLVAHEILDWIISSHDTHTGNYLLDAHGNVVGIDKGQSWKFLGKDKLDPNYWPKGNFGDPIYKKVWDAFAAGEVEHADAEGVARKIFAEVAKISPAQFKDIIEPYAVTVAQKLGKDEQEVADKLVERFKSAKGDWEKFLTKQLGHPVNLDAQAEPTPTVEVLEGPPAAMEVPDMPKVPAAAETAPSEPPKPAPPPVSKPAPPPVSKPMPGWPQTKGTVTIHSPGVAPSATKWPKGAPGVGFHAEVSYKKQTYHVEFGSESGKFSATVTFPNGTKKTYDSPNKAGDALYLFHNGLDLDMTGTEKQAKAISYPWAKAFGVKTFAAELAQVFGDKPPIVESVKELEAAKEVSPEVAEIPAHPPEPEISEPPAKVLAPGENKPGKSNWEWFDSLGIAAKAGSETKMKVLLAAQPVGTEIKYEDQGDHLVIQKKPDGQWGYADASEVGKFSEKETAGFLQPAGKFLVSKPAGVAPPVPETPAAPAPAPAPAAKEVPTVKVQGFFGPADIPNPIAESDAEGGLAALPAGATIDLGGVIYTKTTAGQWKSADGMTYPAKGVLGMVFGPVSWGVPPDKLITETPAPVVEAPAPAPEPVKSGPTPMTFHPTSAAEVAAIAGSMLNGTTLSVGPSVWTKVDGGFTDSDGHVVSAADAYDDIAFYADETGGSVDLLPAVEEQPAQPAPAPKPEKMKSKLAGKVGDSDYNWEWFDDLTLSGLNSQPEGAIIQFYLDDNLVEATKSGTIWNTDDFGSIYGTAFLDKLKQADHGAVIITLPESEEPSVPETKPAADQLFESDWKVMKDKLDLLAVGTVVTIGVNSWKKTDGSSWSTVDKDTDELVPETSQGTKWMAQDLVDSVVTVTPPAPIAPAHGADNWESFPDAEDVIASHMPDTMASSTMEAVMLDQPVGTKVKSSLMVWEKIGLDQWKNSYGVVMSNFSAGVGVLATHDVKDLQVAKPPVTEKESESVKWSPTLHSFDISDMTGDNALGILTDAPSGAQFKIGYATWTKMASGAFTDSTGESISAFQAVQEMAKLGQPIVVDHSFIAPAAPAPAAPPALHTFVGQPGPSGSNWEWFEGMTPFVAQKIGTGGDTFLPGTSLKFEWHGGEFQVTKEQGTVWHFDDVPGGNVPSLTQLLSEADDGKILISEPEEDSAPATEPAAVFKPSGLHDFALASAIADAPLGTILSLGPDAPKYMKVDAGWQNQNNILGNSFFSNSEVAEFAHAAQKEITLENPKAQATATPTSPPVDMVFQINGAKIIKNTAEGWKHLPDAVANTLANLYKKKGEIDWTKLAPDSTHAVGEKPSGWPDWMPPPGVLVEGEHEGKKYWLRVASPGYSSTTGVPADKVRIQIIGEDGYSLASQKNLNPTMAAVKSAAGKYGPLSGLTAAQLKKVFGLDKLVVPAGATVATLKGGQVKAVPKPKAPPPPPPQVFVPKVKTPEQVAAEAKLKATQEWVATTVSVKDPAVLKALAVVQAKFSDSGTNGAMWARALPDGRVLVGSPNSAFLEFAKYAGFTETVETPAGTAFSVSVADLFEMSGEKAPVVGPDGKQYPAGTTFETKTLDFTLSDLVKAEGVQINPHNTDANTVVLKLLGKGADQLAKAEELIKKHGLKPQGKIVQSEKAGATFVFLPKAEMEKVAKSETLVTPTIPESISKPFIPTAIAGSGGLAKDGEVAHNNRADLAMLDVIKFKIHGHPIRMGTAGMLADHQVLVRKVRDASGKLFYEFSGTLAKFDKSVNGTAYFFDCHATDAPGDLRINFDPATGFTTESSNVFRNYSAFVAKAGAASVEVIKDNAAAALKNAFRIRMPLDANVEEELRGAFKAMGVDDDKMLNHPTEADDRLFIKQQVLRSLMGPQGYNALLSGKLNDESYVDEQLNSPALAEYKPMDLVKGATIKVSAGGSPTVVLDDAERFKDVKFITRTCPHFSGFKVIWEGAFLSRARGALLGFWPPGQSADGDMASGGAKGVFTRLAHKVLFKKSGFGAWGENPKLIYHPRILQRTDCWTYPGDTFGNISGHSSGSGEFEASTGKGRYHFIDGPGKEQLGGSNETMFEHGISSSDLAGVQVNSEYEKKKLIAAMNAQGITAMNTIPLDQFIVVYNGSSKKELESLIVGLKPGVLP